MNVVRMASLIFFTALLASTPLSARNAQEVASPRPETLRAADLELRYFTPRASNTDELFDTLARLYRREVMFELEGGRPLTSVFNMTTFGNSVILYDTPAQVQRILAALEQLEKIAIAREAADRAQRSAMDPQAETVVVEYGPRFLDLVTVRSVLAPFARTVRLQDERSRSYEQDNLSFVKEPATVVMRDTGEHVAQMTKILERFDRPAPQVMLTAQLLLAKDAGGNAGLPLDFAENLTKLVGYEHFEAIAMSTVRTSVGPEQELTLQLATSDDTYELRIRCSAFDAKSGSLTIKECRLERQADENTLLFATACVVGPNEYTVLGSSGPTPLFAVVRMVPLTKN